jgi:transcriptional regulator with XRE-family HTH domain
MPDAPPIPNGIEAERIAHGIETRQELAERADIDAVALAQIEEGRILPTRAELDRLVAALDDVPAERLYSMSWRQIIGGHRSDETPSDRSRMFRDWSDRGHMLVARNELTWFERQPTTEGPVDAYVNLSCGTQLTPHLLLDTVAVLRALDVRFVAAAGPTACCGKAVPGDGPARRRREACPREARTESVVGSVGPRQLVHRLSADIDGGGRSAGARPRCRAPGPRGAGAVVRRGARAPVGRRAPVETDGASPRPG